MSVCCKHVTHILTSRGHWTTVLAPNYALLQCTKLTSPLCYGKVAEMLSFLWPAIAFVLKPTNLSGRIRLTWNKSIRDESHFFQVWKHQLQTWKYISEEISQCNLNQKEIDFHREKCGKWWGCELDYAPDEGLSRKIGFISVIGLQTKILTGKKDKKLFSFLQEAPLHLLVKCCLVEFEWQTNN